MMLYKEWMHVFWKDTVTGYSTEDASGVIQIAVLVVEIWLAPMAPNWQQS